MKHRLMLGRAARTQGEVATPYSTTRNARQNKLCSMDGIWRLAAAIS